MARSSGWCTTRAVLLCHRSHEHLHHCRGRSRSPSRGPSHCLLRASPQPRRCRSRLRPRSCCHSCSLGEAKTTRPSDPVDSVNSIGDGDVQQGDEADEAFGGTVPRMEAPPHARAVSFGRGHRLAAYPRCSPDQRGAVVLDWRRAHDDRSRGRRAGQHPAHGAGSSSAGFACPRDPTGAGGAGECPAERGGAGCRLAAS